MDSPRCFSPRPFPPPALVDVPLEYIVDQLHNLASNYWNKPDTADCIIGRRLVLDNDSHPHYASLVVPIPNPPGRRPTDPDIHSVPHLTLRVCTMCLRSHTVLTP